MNDFALNAARRERELDEATDGRVADLLVVGLGATGAGVALDAAARGLSVVAVDAHDLAFGTSRWSSKLIHGGLRYLAKGQFAIAHESAVERGILMTSTAPHLIRPLPMLVPLTANVSTLQGLVARAGIMAGDVLRATAHTPRETLPVPRKLSRTETLRMARGIRHDGLRGGLLSWDGQLEDDARLVTALARTAAANGARILTRCRVLDLHGDGAVIRDEWSGGTSAIKARAVINATGVWADSLVDGIALRPSRGTHLVVRSPALGNPSVALTAPVPGETNRFVFALPQPDGLTYIGLTDEPADDVPDIPQPSTPEIGFLLDVISGVLETPLRSDDVVGSFAGLRPLLSSFGSTADLSRKHAVLTSKEGVVTVVGGKLTTYRKMAEDAVDTAVRLHGIDARGCRTRLLPLIGAGDTTGLRGMGIPERFIRKYGTDAALLSRDPEMLRPISDTIEITPAELAWGVEHEGALDTGDLLDRRTRIGLVPTDRAVAVPFAERALDRAKPSASIN